MKLGRVIGTVVSTVNHPSHDHRRLLVVELTDPEFRARDAAHGGPQQLIAIDSVQSGVGDHVLILDEGNGARQVLCDKSLPVRSVIIGIVDAVTLAD